LSILFNSFLLVFISEMGDKTQLLALVLATRYKKPIPIMAGIFVATILNHALAAWAGQWIGGYFSEQTLKWVLSLTFFVFALWILVPDKEGAVTAPQKFGVFLTTTVAFFLAEMGDKTQLATVALGAQYTNTLLVTLGTTLGMMGSNALAVFFGQRFLNKVPMKWVRIFACALFALFGLVILLK
jgi:Ca2+/H+ antiporter, TMEM165/GDT1 family